MNRLSKTFSFLLVAAFFLMLAQASSSEASGKGQHSHGEEMTDHMLAMQSAKKDIPEVYRIMERTPIFADAESLNRGGELFTQNCSVCHGENGDGKGPAAAAMQTPPANFLDISHSSTYNPGEKYWIIGNGTEATGMPAFSQLNPVDRWHLVNHILHIQQNKPAEQKKHGHD